MELDPIRALVANDIEAVNGLIRERLSSDVALINRLGSYIINSGGKRLRPLVVLLAARACGCRDHKHILLAAIVEMIHTATLLHDDVVDESDMRRGRETARQIWGNGASVLVGDFLYTRAFEMMVELQRTAVMEIFSRATNTIAEGEVLQLLNIHDPDVTEERYRDVIFRKTAALFEAGCRLAALMGARSAQDQAAMAAYGRHLGTAFQLIDDALDYDGNAEEIGKNIGDDLAEGKPTMPFIYAMRTGDAKTRELMRSAIRQGGQKQIEAVREAIEKTGAITYTYFLANEEADRAVAMLERLETGVYRDALAALVRFAISRRY
ncbi:MAG: polyprenyl synthetase family protein [Nitrococcus mobilis]|nr:polyprenyl synthetase family protein [Nitrococcus mobilis]